MALRAVEVVADLVAAVALAQGAVQTLLNRQLGATANDTVRALLRGVLLADQANPNALIAGVFDPATLLARFRRLFTNLAGLGIAIDLGDVTIAFAKGGSGNNVIGLRLSIEDRFELINSDTMLWLENDDRWIVPDPSLSSNGGLFVGFMPDDAPRVQADARRRGRRAAARQVARAAARCRRHARVDRAARLRRDRLGRRRQPVQGRRGADPVLEPRRRRQRRRRRATASRRE